MSKRIRPLYVLAVLTVLVFSYFARPLYDFVWVAAGRATSAVAIRLSPPMVRQDRDATLARIDQQAREIDGYLSARRAALSQGGPLQGLDFSSPQAFDRSTAPLRESFRQSLRYPPAGFENTSPGPVKELATSEDEFATYRLLQIPVLPGVHAYGYYLRPKGAAASEKLPLVISAHGRDGKPDPTADGKLPVVQPQSRDMAWDAVKHGYAVWLPSFTHYTTEQPDFRDRLTVRAWEAGNSLPAIEIAKVVKALDALLLRDDIDPARVAMMGHSYGGFYTLYTTALEPRIRVAVVAAYFNDREQVLDSSAPYGFLDWRYPDSLTLWRDPAVVAMVAPRPLLIEAGNQDQLFPIEGARRAAPIAAQVYDKLGIGDRFKFDEFVARHDFDGKAAMDFIDSHLGRGASAAR